MDFGAILTGGAAVIGQVAHVVKKRVQAGGEDEVAAFKSQVLKKPFHTLAAAIGAIAASTQLVDPATMELVQQLVMAFTVGYTSDSVINRPG